MITSYRYYTIFFQDQAEYNAAVATAGGNGYPHSPENAATTFGIPWPPPSGDLALIPRGFINAGDFTINGFSPDPAYLTTDIDSIVVSGVAGNPPTIFPATQDCTFIWQGIIQWMPAEVAGAPPVTSIPQRRWISGFEHSGVSVEGGNTLYALARCASRVTGGQGFRVRGNAGTTYNQTKFVDEYRTGLTPKSSWERFYIRIGQLGTNEFIAWKCLGNSPSNEGAYLAINTSGNILLYNGVVGSGTLEATSATALSVNRWYLVDILMNWPTVAGDSGQIRVFINHSAFVSYTINTGAGMDRITYHDSSTLGQQSTRESYWEVDFDTWICADVPEYLGAESLNSIDWLSGSHVKTVNVKSASLGSFTGGDFTALNQYFNPTLSNTSTSALTSAVALDTIEGLADEEDGVLEGLGIPFGPIALVSEANLFNGITENARVGFKIAGGALQWRTVSVGAADAWYSNAHLPTVTTPTSFVPISVAFERPNSGITSRVNALSAIVEYIGLWGQEDDSVFPFDLSNNIWHHNCRVANTPWALFPYIGNQASPTYAIGGTFVGNGTGTVINLPAPPHFIWIRGVTTGASPIQWFGAGMGGHDGGDFDVLPGFVSRVWYDATGYHFSVSGANASSNFSGRTFQYIVFCDPGMRFNYCDAYDYAAIRASVNKAIFDPVWLAEAGFVQKEKLNSGGAVINLAYKGPGHTGNTGVNFNGTELTDFGAFSAGQINIRSDILDDANATSQFNFSLWRMQDYQGDVMVQVTSYVGDGGAAQVVPFPMITGRFPLFALVVPNNGTDAYFRDPSHSGANSQISTSGTNSTTAIIGGGKDFITVGSTLNTLGVTYEVFIILGDTAGWNNGTFYPGFGDSSGPWTNPPSSGDPIIVMDGGLNFNGAAPYLALEDSSGIYTLVPNKRNDTLYSKSDDTTVDVPIPDASYKTGFIGG